MKKFHKICHTKTHPPEGYTIINILGFFCFKSLQKNSGLNKIRKVHFPPTHNNPSWEKFKGGERQHYMR